MSAGDVDPVGERDLLAYVDGRLAAERRRVVEDHLADRPEERVRIEAYLQQNAALRRALGGIAAEPVPPVLRTMVENAPAPAASRRRGGWVAAAAMLSVAVGLSGGLGWWLGRNDDEAGHARAFVQALAALPATAGHAGAPLTTRGPDSNAPLDWLEQRIAMDLRAPDLSGAGWRLHRRELVNVDGRPTVRLGYVDAEGRAVEVYLRQRWSATRGEPDIATAAYGDARAAYWFDGPLVWALVGELATAELETLGRAAHGSMRLRPMPRGPEMLQIAPLDDPVLPQRPAARNDATMSFGGAGRTTSTE